MVIGDLDQTRLALAALTACIARTLDELDADFGGTFEKYLDYAYVRLKETSDTLGALETVARTP